MQGRERVLVERFIGLDEFGKDHEVSLFDVYDIETGVGVDSRTLVERVAESSDGSALTPVSDDVFRVLGTEWVITRKK
ncbi:hypothetical protein [Mesorhizobium loti]|uniref:hypothetical protein n=1 Tax=Rhizobium loti TaxID=381 RepID=UPI00047D3313|nr:hypothetical protein [Mesorhizobium loti]